MPLSMNMNPFITCAVTGSGGSQNRSPHVPRSPKQIAESAIDAAKAGAAVVHCHVGEPSRRLELYRELIDRIRDSQTDVVVNFTAGMGGDLVFGDPENPMDLDLAGTDMAGATERIAHVAECLPEICTLDCGTMNFAEADYVMTNTPGMLRAMGQMMTDIGVRPEIQDPVMVQMCMGIPWGAPDDLNTFMSMVNNTPEKWTFSAFSIGQHQMPYVAAAILAGGNVRVGLEDNIWLAKGELATNAQLVEKAASIADKMGATLMSAEDVRTKMQLTKRAAVSK
jgi:uncharacterized protein (DUF849 family)